MDLKTATILVTVISLCMGCRPYKYKVINKRAQIVMDIYPDEETVVFRNIILCSNINTLLSNEQIMINEDSVLKIFSTALLKTGMSFVFKKDGINFCDEGYHKNKLIRSKKIDADEIIKISQPNATLSAVPFIYIHNRSLKNRYITSQGIPGGGEYLRDTFLNIMVYLVKDDEIVYHKSAWYGPVSSKTFTYG